MAQCNTIKIQTGVDSFIVVNEEDYESFKYMEYTPAPKQEQIEIPTEAIDETPTSTRRRKAIEE